MEAALEIYQACNKGNPTCVAPQVLQFEAVIWGPKQGEIQELHPLPGDLDGTATAINNKGQVAGCSGICENAASFYGCVHAVVWENGSPTNTGDLGGTVNVAVAINNRGQALGISILPDNTIRSFLWENGVITAFGVLAGDVCGGFACVLTFADGINNKAQVVGHSCDITDTYCSAWLWQNGVLTDLNTLIPPGSSLFLAFAGDINDGGEITGKAVDQVTGEAPAFLAIPCDEKQSDAEGCNEDQEGSAASRTQASERPKVALPENVRNLLQRRLRLYRGEDDRKVPGTELTADNAQPATVNFLREELGINVGRATGSTSCISRGSYGCGKGQNCCAFLYCLEGRC